MSGMAADLQAYLWDAAEQSPWQAAGLFFAALPLILLLLYPIAIQYNRGGAWRILAPVLVVALVIDVLANYTTLIVLMADFPEAGEYTFSVRLRRLQHEEGWRGRIARPIVAWLNAVDPLHNHVTPAEVT